MCTFKEITLKNKNYEKKRLIIEFDDPNKTILAQFLMTEVAGKGEQFLQQINELHAGVRQVISGAGNICAWEISSEYAQIEDLFSAETTTKNPSYEIKTVNLQSIIEIWANKYTAWKNGEEI